MNSTVDTATTGDSSDHMDLDLEDQPVEDPVVLAFSPGAFPPPCTDEMGSLQERLDGIGAAGGMGLRVSADSPFAQGASHGEHDIEFTLVSDVAGDAIDVDDLRIDAPSADTASRTAWSSSSTIAVL